MQLDFQIVLAKVRKDNELLSKWVPYPNPNPRTRKSSGPRQRKSGTKKPTRVKAEKQPEREEVINSDNSDNWISATED